MSMSCTEYPGDSSIRAFTCFALRLKLNVSGETATVASGGGSAPPKIDTELSPALLTTNAPEPEGSNATYEGFSPATIVATTWSVSGATTSSAMTATPEPKSSDTTRMTVSVTMNARPPSGETETLFADVPLPLLPITW